MKLNIGSGKHGSVSLNYITLDHTDWKFVDICSTYNPHECYDISQGIREINNSVDEIYMGDFFEHLLRIKSYFVLNECFRVLKNSGSVLICVPDMEMVMPRWLSAIISNNELERISCSELIWGQQDEICQIIGANNNIPDSHFHGYTQISLTNMLIDAGFKNITRLNLNNRWYELTLKAYKI